MKDEDYDDADSSQFHDADSSQFQDAEETGVDKMPSDIGMQETCLATFRSPDMKSHDGIFDDSAGHQHSQSSIRTSQPETTVCNSDGIMHVDLLEADTGYRSGTGMKDISASSFTTSSEETQPPQASNIFCNNKEQNMSEIPDFDYSSKIVTCSDNTIYDLDNQETTSECQSRVESSSKSQLICERLKSIECLSVESVNSPIDSDRKLLNILSSSDPVNNLKHSDKTKIMEELNSQDSSNFDLVVPDRKCSSTTDNQFKHNSVEVNSVLHELPSHINNDPIHQRGVELPSHINNDSIHQRGVTADQYSSSGITSDHGPVIVHSEDNCQLSDAVLHQPESTILNSDLPSQHSQTSDSTNQCDFHQTQKLKTASFGSTCIDSGANISDDSNYSVEASLDASCSYNSNVTHQSYTQSDTLEEEYKQSVAGEDSYKQSVAGADNYKQSVAEEDKYTKSTVSSCEHKLTQDQDSCFTHMVDNGESMLDYTQTTSHEEVSSYRQYSCNDAEEMDTETFDDENVAQVATNSNVYQSYEEDLAPNDQTVTTAVLVDMPVVSQHETNESHTIELNPTDGTNSIAALPKSQAPNGETSDISSTSMSTEITADAAISSTEDHATTSTSSSPSLSHQHLEPNTGDHERAFTQAEQAFMSAGSRRQMSIPFMPAGCSLPYVPGMNPSMYAGAAMVQGMTRPTLMTSSSVHFAQHPGGATIMQHQSMSTGINGAMAHATVMQQQAMPNGLQATSVLQRTLTNGGQTMVMQQRTMTTGLDGMTQQTVVQQQVAGPSMAQAAMFHANAMRQRTMATQQASMMQQRAIRLVQAGVMGNQVLHAQTMGGPTLVPRGTALVGHGLLRGVSQGTMMQQLVRQRYLGGPVMPGRGVQLMAGRPIRVKMTYPREMQMDT